MAGHNGIRWGGSCRLEVDIPDQSRTPAPGKQTASPRAWGHRRLLRYLSNVRLLGYLQSVINFDAEVSDRALELCVSQ